MSEEKKYLLTFGEIILLHGIMGCGLEYEAYIREHEYRERTCYNTDKRRMMFDCSACGYVIEYDLYAEELGYCPSCGAKVVGQ